MKRQKCNFDKFANAIKAVKRIKRADSDTVSHYSEEYANPLHYGLSGMLLREWLSALRQLSLGLPRQTVTIYGNLAGLMLAKRGLLEPRVCETCKRQFANQYTVSDSVIPPKATELRI